MMERGRKKRETQKETVREKRKRDAEKERIREEAKDRDNERE